MWWEQSFWRSRASFHNKCNNGNEFLQYSWCIEETFLHLNNAVMMSYFCHKWANPLLKMSLNVVWKGPNPAYKLKAPGSFHFLLSSRHGSIITLYYRIRWHLVSQRLSLGCFFLDVQLSDGVYPGRLQSVSACSPVPLTLLDGNKAVWVRDQLRTMEHFSFYHSGLAEGLVLLRHYWTLQHGQPTTQTAFIVAGILNELRQMVFIGSAAAAAVLQLERKAFPQSKGLWAALWLVIGLLCKTK